VTTEGERAVIKSQLEKEQPELDKLVSQRRHTAIIAANDNVATEFVTWMTYTGRSVPRDMSLISFDNNPGLALYRLSSLDFGMADLGYLIAHRFIGDVAVHKDVNGNITVMPRFFDRGSIIPLSPWKLASKRDR
jgi:DNA-binding LacI/PurR family transcriptional regulator